MRLLFRSSMLRFGVALVMIAWHRSTQLSPERRWRPARTFSVDAAQYASAAEACVERIAVARQPQAAAGGAQSKSDQAHVTQVTWVCAVESCVRRNVK